MKGRSEELKQSMVGNKTSYRLSRSRVTVVCKRIRAFGFCKKGTRFRKGNFKICERDCLTYAFQYHNLEFLKINRFSTEYFTFEK